MALDKKDVLTKMSLILCPPLGLFAIVHYSLYEELVVCACFVGLWYLIRRKISRERSLVRAIYYGGVVLFLIVVHKASNHTIAIENGTNRSVNHIQISTTGWLHSATGLRPGNQAEFHYTGLLFDRKIWSVHGTFVDGGLIQLKQGCDVSYWSTTHLVIRKNGDITPSED